MHGDGHEWFRSLRTLLYDAYWPPFHPRLDYEPERGVAVAKAMGADAIRFGTVGKWALFPSAVMPHHPGLGGRDLLAETIAAAKREGVKVIAYAPVGHGLPRPLVEVDRPAWAYVLDDGKPPAGSRHFGGPEVVPVCTFGPYREDVLAMLREIVAHDIDGLYIDGPYQGWIFEDTLCQCPSCKRLFLERTGRALPSNAAPRDPAHAAFVADGLAALMAEIRAIASTKNLPLLFNSCAMEYLGSDRQAALAELADGFLVESSMGGIKGIGKGLYHDKVIWNYTRRHSCWPRLSEPEDEAEDCVSALLSTAQGATPIVSYGGRFLYDGSCRGPLTETFKYLESIKPGVKGARPSRHAAVVCPAGLSTKDDAAVLAAYELLRELGLQCVATPRDLLLDPAALAEFAFVMLPSFDRLELGEVEVLLNYVAAGGGLLATGARLVANDRDALRRLFLLEPASELLTLSETFRWDQVDSPYECYLRWRGRLLPLGEYGMTRALEGSEILADIVIGGDGQGLLPGVVERRLGKGRAVFVPSSLELTWQATRNRGLADFAGYLCGSVSSRPPTFKASGAAKVFINVFDTADKGLAAHLVDCDPGRDLVEGLSLELSVPFGAEVVKATRLSDASDMPFSVADSWLRFEPLAFRKGECVEIKLKWRL